MITVNVKQLRLRLGENYYQIPYSVIKKSRYQRGCTFYCKRF